MAGKIALDLFSSVFMLVLGIEINYHECQRKQSTLQCPWRGVGNYEVTVPMLQEVLQVEKLTKESTLIVPERFSGRLTKNRSSTGRRIMHADICTFICICLC